jgi:hypothetical protein
MTYVRNLSSLSAIPVEIGIRRIEGQTDDMMISVEPKFSFKNLSKQFSKMTSKPNKI